MKIPNFLANFVLKSDNIQNVINEKIELEKQSWAKQTAETLLKKTQERTGSRQYVLTTPGFKDNKTNALYSGKNYSTLYTLYSEMPGSVQCVNRIVDSILGSGYSIEKIQGQSGTKKDLKTLIDFFDNPNPDETIEMLVSEGLTNYLRYGDWYIEKVPTKGSINSKNFQVAELYTLDTAKIKILVDKIKKDQGVLKKVGYLQEVEAGKEIKYTLNKIAHFRRPNPSAGIYGKAVLETNNAINQMTLQAITYNLSMLKNGGVPTLQLILPEDSNESDAEAVSVWFEKNYMGAHNAGKPMVTFKGAKAENLGLKPEDIKFLDLLKFGMSLVSGQYGVPLFMIGFPEDTNRSSASELRRAYYYNLIYPLRKFISKKLTTEVIQKGKGISGWKLDFRGAGLEESESTRRDTISGMKNGVYTWNEGRTKIGLLPLEDDWADKPYLVGSKNDFMMPVEEAVNLKPTPNSKDTKNPSNEGGPSQGEGADTNQD